jgi:hypothetical protein
VKPGSQAVTPVGVTTTIEDAMEEVLRRMGSRSTRRDFIELSEVREKFPVLVRRVTTAVTRQVLQRIELSKNKLKKRIKDILAIWDKSNVLLQKGGRWCFNGARLRALRRKRAQDKSDERPSSRSSTPYLNRPHARHVRAI